MDNQQYDEDFHGGMYNLLKLVDKILFKATEKEFTAKEIKIFCPNVSKDSLSNNLTRLVNAGFLERSEYRDTTNYNCRVVKYKLKEDVINEIRRSLHN